MAFSMALDAMGFQSSAAVERVAGLGHFLNGLGGALPGILAIGAGIAGIAVGAEAFEISVDAASELQSSMSQLGQAVKNQGGDWTKLSAEVKAFADDQERTTTFSNVQVIQSLNKLVETGMSLSDSMTVVRVKADAAAATGKSLIDVTNALMEAEHGRTRVLSELGIGTRQSIHDGMSFDEILSTIEQHMGGAAASARSPTLCSLSALGAQPGST